MMEGGVYRLPMRIGNSNSSHINASASVVFIDYL